MSRQQGQVTVTMSAKKVIRREGAKPGSTTEDGGKPQGRGNEKTKPAADRRAGGASKKKDKGDKSVNKRRKTFITLSYIVLAYMVCWVPFHVFCR